MNKQSYRQQKTGVAISRAGKQTVIVRVDTYVPHPLYKKRIRQTKRFAAHDQADAVKAGDTVVIGETRPISKTKHWEIIQITSKSPEVSID
ncbi:TPA: 30S ribosomal protein S17 [Patescibacteria group bacterium]|uniref:Small ribosomal subunit protein uS17 n=2 Tax=Bacteria division Kazan-3B-28 TaxID=1798534 RepID=A0A0G1X6D8_UNCK3|nr:MAG: 30S ribosomal protein S17 [candidate division Kazan bacterium GW2011_GWA1_50_15]KKW25407.1 MAG: 30S ribosomal protein S17 [candidate division Kazan bacterium GW2011_GWC1_52_13]KKW26713.1 MAG: 30S ribosomal protein S17 [candidate division Kazan bacterium GW2011_GWB1_52_7]HAV65710.1 30S ribosomal protein S17 [Patescibacteria group bacterium]HCL47572.1 30S ribosomal protein S17 [Patescibacteria group bacterium]